MAIRIRTSSYFLDDLVGHHSSFRAPSDYVTKFEGKSLTGALNSVVGGIYFRCRRKSPFILETVREEPMVTVTLKGGRETPIFRRSFVRRSTVVPFDLELDPEQTFL